MQNLRYLLAILLLSVTVACTDTSPAGKSVTNQQNSPTAYIIYCKKDCANVEKDIRVAGGNVRQRYANFDVLAFELPDPTIDAKSLLAKFSVVKDKQIKAPEPVDLHDVLASKKIAMNNAIQALNPAPDISTKSYGGTNQKIGAFELHTENILGQGVIVAIIDSGTANAPETVPLISGSVIGGENFVNEEGEPSATSTLNDPHGTWVGSMIAAHGSVMVDKGGPLADALAVYAPGSFVDVSETQIEVPVIGSAPAASLYPFKVFGADGAGAPSSRVIAAMDRVLTLKTNFDQGIPSEPVAGDGSEDNPFIYDSLNIQVVNMSLGGPSLFPGLELDDVITDAMLDAGIVVVAAAGNEGFAAITGGSPGTGIGSIAVGASNDFVHERVFREVRGGPGVGIAFRPTTHPQIAPFSSRGPTADGRDGVDVVANGRAVFVQGADGGMALVSGTSFSAPTVAGAAALLWSGSPTSDALSIRTALIEGADPEVFLPGTTVFDQGHGLLDVEESLELLQEGLPPAHLPDMPLAAINSKVIDNITARGIPVFSLAQAEYEAEITLIPGQVHQIFVETAADTHDIVIEIDDFVTQLPPAQQNSIFGDEFILEVVDAQLSVDHVVLQELITGPQTFTVSHPQPGLVRVSLLGDWTNAGLVSAEVSVRRLTEPPLAPAISGTIADGEVQLYEVNVDPSVSFLTFGLSWINDWSFYPSHDLDIFVIDPEGNPYFDGATLHSPEMFGVDLPLPGTWTIHVDGFLMHEFSNNFELIVSDQNGVPLVVN